MLPLAMLGPVELAIVITGCFLVYKLVCGGANCATATGGQKPDSAPKPQGVATRTLGVVAKSLGVAAVVAGIGVLLIKADRGDDSLVYVEEGVVEDMHLDDVRVHVDVQHEFEHLDRDHNHNENATAVQDLFEPNAERSGTTIRTHHVRPHYAMLGVLTLLGSGLIILGAMLIGREKTRPLALKAVTWLGVGAILFSTVNFFSDAPRVPQDMRAEISGDVDVEAPQRARRPSRAGRAKRPALRPDRPIEGRTPTQPEVSLPPRAGDIPVEVELAKVEVAVPEVPAKPEPTKESEPDNPAPEQPAVEKPAEAVAANANTTPAAVIAMNANATAVPRPAWVDAPAALVGGVYTLVVNSGPYVSVPECQHALDEAVLAAANHYINEYVGDEQAAALVNVSPAYLRNHVKRAEFAEVLQTQSVGAMHQLYARLEFDEKARADIQQSWRRAVVQDRLWYTGGGTVLVLALLATFYGYLKLDLKSGASNRGQLQLAATLVALIVVAGALLARWAVPF